jgi:hypothetical protein
VSADSVVMRCVGRFRGLMGMGLIRYDVGEGCEDAFREGCRDVDVGGVIDGRRVCGSEKVN